MSDLLAAPNSEDLMIGRFTDLLGKAAVISEPEDMAPYLTGPTRSRGQALCVIRPSDTAGVAAAVRLAADLGLKIVPQGGNTGLSDGAIPGGRSQIVLSLTRMNRIRAIDEASATITVDAGVILAQAQEAARGAGLMLPFSIGSEGSCTVGGNLATNAGGKGALRYGTAAGLALGLEVVLADGRVWNGLRSLRKDNTGLDLKQLFLGSEGRLGIITGAVLSLVPAQNRRVSAFVALSSAEDALRLLNLARRRVGTMISAFELMNGYTLATTTKHLQQRTPFSVKPEWAVLMELAAGDEQAGLQDMLVDFLADAQTEGCLIDAVVAANEQQARDFWRLRDDGATLFWKEGAFLLHDPSVPVARVPEFIAMVCRGAEDILPETRIAAFGHVGDGNIHIIASQPPGYDKKAFVALRGQFQQMVYGAANSLGGSFSAEHGIGGIKTAALEDYREPVHLALMDAVKAALDPASVLNPGKVRG